MNEAILELAKTFGFPVAISAFLLWWVRGEMDRARKESAEREKRLSVRLDQVQDARTTELAGVIRDNTSAMRALADRPCMMQAKP